MKISKIALSLSVVFSLFYGCRTQPVNIVKIPVKSKSTIDFVKYDKILYKPFIYKNFPIGYDPGPSVDFFFLNEFKKIIKKDISKYSSDNKKSVITNSEKSLLIIGEIILDIKIRHVVDRKKRRKKGVFVKIENWNMKMDIKFIDMNTGKNIFNKILKEKILSTDGKRPDYNFEFLFGKVTEKFVRYFLGLGRYETRYLMKKRDKK